MYFSVMDWTHLLNLEFPQLPLDAEDEAVLKKLAKSFRITILTTAQITQAR